MNEINIDNLSQKELIELNRKIVNRIRELNKIKLSQQLQNFRIGEQVTFRNNEGNTITGIVVRINQKTLSIKTKEGLWYVHPGNVTKL